MHGAWLFQDDDRRKMDRGTRRKWAMAVGAKSTIALLMPHSNCMVVLVSPLPSWLHLLTMF